jgi:hypothetical protein
MSKECILMISIFTTDSYHANLALRKHHKQPCLFSSSEPISQLIPPDIGLFVLEANNTDNRIMGIGYIKNTPKTNSIYSSDSSFSKYNKYVYCGKAHISRDDPSLTADDLLLFEVLEQLCFHGKTHLKRCSGIVRFPIKWLHNLKKSKHQYDVLIKIRNIIKRKYSTTSSSHQHE